MNYTEKQKKAIENQGNILVSAAAGSGKTRVMTERICRIIQSEKASVDELLVLTFTDAAAAEMKKRIYESLMKISDSERLGVMAEKVASADICTIHSFCQRIIRDKYYVLGLSPSFNIAAEKDNTRLLKKTLTALLEARTLTEDADLARLYLKYGKRNGQALNEMIIALYQALMVMPEPDVFQQSVLADYRSEDFKTAIASVLFGKAEQKLLYAKDILENLLCLSADSDMPNLHATLELYTQNITTVIEHIRRRDWEAAKSTTVFHANLITKEIADDEIKKIFKNGRKSVKETLDEVLDESLYLSLDHSLDKEVPLVLNDAKILLDLALTLRLRFSEAKMQKNMLDFNDLEHYAYEILKSPGQLETLNYKYIFVDEYQDINPLQEAIIAAVTGAHNLFLVGDVKQSIYGFRHADSDIFLEKQNRFKEFDQKPYDEDELIRMNENFRSSGAVINAVNDLMGDLLTPNFGRIDYRAKEALVHASGLTDGSAELLLIDSDADFMPPEHSGDTLSSVEAEAFAIANRMNEMKDRPFFSREAGEEKKLDFCDMVVLLRELKNTGPVFKRVFESCGIPVDISLSSGDTSIPETKQFANILRCVLNPTDDIALVSAMKYEYFKISSDDIAKIRIDALEKNQSFYACVCDYLEVNADSLSTQIAQFFETLAYLKRKAMVLSGEAFLNVVYHHLRFEEILAASPRKSLKAEALKGFILSLLAELPRSAHLARMVALLDEMEQNGEALEAGSLHKHPNSVRLFTIHKSKGLEFPVVFVGGLQKPFLQDNKNDYVLDKRLGIGFKILEPAKNYKRNGLIYQSLVEKQRLAALEEYIRVLYVAMTRAENHLFLVSSVKRLKSSIAHWLTYGQQARFVAKTYMDLIAPAVLNKPAFAEGFSSGRFLPPVLSSSPNLPISLLPKRGYVYAKSVDRQAALSDFLNQKPKPVEIGYAYAYAESLAIPSKRSVSSLKPKSETTFPKRQAAFTALDASSLSAAERGTAFHVYMQHADFNHNTLAEVKDHIGQLVKAQVITQDEAVALSPEKILNILKSDIIARAKKAPLRYREKNFSLKMDSGDLNFAPGEMVVVQGTIDLCFIENGKFVLVDYKTDGVTKDTLAPRIDSYRIQIETYARALTALTGYPVQEKYLYFLNFGCIKV